MGYGHPAAVAVRRLLLPLVLAAFSMSAHADALLDHAWQLINSGNGAQAYELLLPQVQQRAGSPDYDYALGVAALDSRRPAEAILAFERVLAVDPNHAQARAELARAYFQTGENQAARHQFEQVLTLNPPAEARESIARYLNAIDHRLGEQHGKLGGYIELSLGVDTNVNSATNDSNVAVPALGNLLVTLSSDGVEKSDSVGVLRGGVTYRHPVSADSDLFLGGNIEARHTAKYTQFSTDSADGFAGMRFHRGKNSYTAAVQYQTMLVDNTRNRDLGGIALQWDHILDNFSQLSGFAQYAQVRYDTQSIRDVDQSSVGVAYAHSLARPGNPVLFSALFIGQDDPRSGLRPDLKRTFWGMRAGTGYPLTQRDRLDFLVSFQDGHYGADDPLFLRTRTDKTLDASLTYSRKLNERWSLKAQLRHTINDSNIPITDYQRSQLLVGARADF